MAVASAAPTSESSRIAERDGWNWLVGRTKIADLKKNFETEGTNSGSSVGDLRNTPKTLSFNVSVTAETFAMSRRRVRCFGTAGASRFASETGTTTF